MHTIREKNLVNVITFIRITLLKFFGFVPMVTIDLYTLFKDIQRTLFNQTTFYLRVFHCRPVARGGFDQVAGNRVLTLMMFGTGLSWLTFNPALPQGLKSDSLDPFGDL